jgi:ATP-binding cassette, subfamily C, bacterial CydC
MDNTAFRPSSQNHPSLIRRLLYFAQPYWKEISLSLILSTATTAANIGLMGTSAWLIASAALQPSIAVLQVAIVGVRTFGIARGVFRYLERLVSHSVNFRLLAQFRGWFFRALEPLVPGAVEDIKAGDLLARSAQDIETLEDFYVRGIAPPLSAAIVTLGISLFTLQYSSSLAVILAGGLILTGFVLSLQLHSLSRSRSDALMNSRSRMASLSMETIQNACEILMSGAEERHLARFKQSSADVRKNSLSMAVLHSFSMAAGVLIANLTLVGMLYVGIPLVQSGRIDGVILAVLALVTLAGFETVNLLPNASIKISTSLAAARRLFDVADRPIPVPEPAHPDSLGEFQELEIKNLSFTYPGTKKPALQNISVRLAPGKKFAIVGPSGSGKTTLFKIIQHYLPAPTGRVFWNGLDVGNLSGRDIQTWLAVLAQNGYLFSATLKENLRLAAPMRDENEFRADLEVMGLSRWIANLPEGMDTWLGDNGSLLSGGEKQRLLLMRTLMMHRPILLADEPFSHLDLASEDLLQKALLQPAENNACLIATHRLVGMDLFDEILVMNDGEIVQRGKHAELSIQPGLYRQLWEQQNNRFTFDQ